MDKLKEKAGEWLLDVAKYVTTAFLVSYWLGDIHQWSAISHIIVILVVVLIIMTGLYLIKSSNKKGGEV